MNLVKRKKRKNLSRTLFIISVLAWPTFCFVWANFVLKINAFTLAFASYEETTGEFFYNAGFENFKKLFLDFSTQKDFKMMLINSAINMGVGVVTIPIPILVAFMIYKKCPCSGFFIIILFLPSVLSSLICVLAYKYMLEYVIPVVFKMDIVISLLLSENAFVYLLIYGVIIGFAGNLVLYTGAMSRIPAELIEQGRLDGMNIMQELIYVVLPLIYPTLSVLFIALPVTFFNGSPNTFAFYSTSARAETWTLGYYFFSILLSSAGVAKKIMYPYASAAGLIFTLIAAPLTFLWKRFLERLDPNVQY